MSSLPTPTPHINAPKDAFAKTVLMPGDPKRSKYVAEHFLKNAVLVNDVRGIQGYTGEYKGKKISVMASGMGIPSIGIYSYELYKFYNVESIIRIGSAGSYREDLQLFDTFLVKDAYSESTFADVAFGIKEHTLPASEELTAKLKKAARNLGIPLKEGTTHSSDVFYHDSPEFVWQNVAKEHNLGCVEMESFALFANAKHLNKQAACLLSISDSFLHSEVTTSEQRRTGFVNMIKIALESFLDE